MKYILCGVLIAFVTSIGTWFLDESQNVAKVTGGTGLLFLILSMIISGSLVNGDRMRANFATETEGDRKERLSWTTKLALLGLPGIIVAVAIYFYEK